MDMQLDQHISDKEEDKSLSDDEFSLSKSYFIWGSVSQPWAWDPMLGRVQCPVIDN